MTPIAFSMQAARIVMGSPTKRPYILDVKTAGKYRKSLLVLPLRLIAPSSVRRGFKETLLSKLAQEMNVSLERTRELIPQQDPADIDYHTARAALMRGIPYSDVTSPMRQETKALFFAINYAATPAGMPDIVSSDALRSLLGRRAAAARMYAYVDAAYPVHISDETDRLEPGPRRISLPFKRN